MSSLKSTARMGLVIAVVFAVFIGAFALPAAAELPYNTRSCKRIDSQIAHFRDVADMAEDRRDYRWWDATRAHIQRLEARRPRLCPEQVAEEKREWFRRGAQAAREAVKLASSMAIRYFTAGTMGGSPF